MLDPKGMNEVVDSTPFMGTEVAVLREYSMLCILVIYV